MRWRTVKGNPGGGGGGGGWGGGGGVFLFGCCRWRAIFRPHLSLLLRPVGSIAASRPGCYFCVAHHASAGYRHLEQSSSVYGHGVEHAAVVLRRARRRVLRGPDPGAGRSRGSWLKPEASSSRPGEERCSIATGDPPPHPWRRKAHRRLRSGPSARCGLRCASGRHGDGHQRPDRGELRADRRRMLGTRGERQAADPASPSDFKKRPPRYADRTLDVRFPAHPHTSTTATADRERAGPRRGESGTHAASSTAGCAAARVVARPRLRDRGQSHLRSPSACTAAATLGHRPPTASASTWPPGRCIVAYQHSDVDLD